MKATLVAVLLLCYAKATALDCMEIAQKALESMDRIELGWVGWTACRVDFDIVESVFVGGVESKDREKKSTSNLVQKDMFHYKMKLGEGQEMLRYGLKFYVADASKKTVEVPDTLSGIVSNMVSLFDAHSPASYYYDTILSTCKSLPESKVGGRPCHVVEYCRLGSSDTVIFFIDKETYQTKQAVLKMTVGSSKGQITYHYDYSMSKNYGIAKEMILENEEQGEVFVTKLIAKNFQVIQNMPEAEFGYEGVEKE